MKLIKQFLKEGGVINGVELINNKLYYVIDTGMKSTLKLYPLKNHKYDVITRYQHFEDVELVNVAELLDFIYEHCMCGRDYMSTSMEELLNKYKIGDGYQDEHTNNTNK